MPALVLGPLLRYVDVHRATIWVETDQPCEVRVLDASARTFCVHGRHYAVVAATGLPAGTELPYEVHLDGVLAWPHHGLQLPPSTIRTAAETASGAAVRVAFGSCRMVLSPDQDHSLTHGIDALRALALEGMRDPAALPDLLFLAGDQVYADEAVERVGELVRSDAPEPRPPGHEVADFEEYARMYGVTWSEPSVRWLLSTVPSVMIFDDHDVRDDWNTSQAWREAIRAQPWWPRRIVGALASYLVYQHLGNLSPEALAELPVWQRMTEAGQDATAVVEAFARAADAHPEGHRWSYRRELGSARLLVVDTRAGRVIDEGARAMLDATEWTWLDEHLVGDVDHLLVGSSLPVLLPVALHDLEAWDEAVAGGAWGSRWAAVGERVRQALDLEHWASFRTSFTALAHALTDVVAGRRGAAPAAVLLLSGDVHHSYLARAHLPGEHAAIWQLVCSPLRNPVGGALRFGFVAAFWRLMAVPMRALRRAAHVPDTPWQWRVEQGPWFGNAICTVELSGRRAVAHWAAARPGVTAELDHLELIASAVLAEG